MRNKIISLRDYDKSLELKKYIGTAHGICFTGMSASFKSAESDLILIAANIEDLNARWFTLFGRIPGSDCVIQQAAAFSFTDMRGKRIWK